MACPVHALGPWEGRKEAFAGVQLFRSWVLAN